MAWETHMLFDKCLPHGTIFDAEDFCLDEGNDSDEVVNGREKAMRTRKIIRVSLKPNYAFDLGLDTEVEVVRVRNRSNGGITFRVRHKYQLYSLHYRVLYYAD